jgi:CheY-like chemotaxis protein
LAGRNYTRDVTRGRLEALGAWGSQQMGSRRSPKCSQETPDAVLCTLVVPVQDGIDFTRRMRELLGIGACG